MTRTPVRINDSHFAAVVGCALLCPCLLAASYHSVIGRADSLDRPGAAAVNRAPQADVRLEPATPPAPVRKVARKIRHLRAYTAQEIERLIERHARKVGLDPDLPLAIARCESGLKWNAANRTSTAQGVFQYLAGTWNRTKAGSSGVSALDADANIRMAVAHIALKGTGPWNASRKCWNVQTPVVEEPSDTDA